MHPIEDCPHNPTFEHIGKTLDRVDRHTERAAIAMEKMAQHGEILGIHEKRLDKHDDDLREAFGRLRTTELYQAKELGVEEVEHHTQEFTDKIKVAVLPYLVSGGLFLIYVFDRLNIGAFLAKLWKEIH